ncbi:ulp1 protease family, C-terminal catalytic domain-containing protein [Artemisia annua]|uniref:Ulp1 protease family, C-terminal catalytic domain-containing protein n=1 Tax=Artemisia annua TaxID=35608 RepID=A0A2U1NX20_ARTAN|nr:ulp1 protease family, C-terminal catalytic domain-containing protein [Artemisia annua]
MYANPWKEWIEYEAIVDLHGQGMVDITFIHWRMMHLYSMVKLLHDNRCAFLNPQCRLNGKKVKEHIIETKQLNPGKTYTWHLICKGNVFACYTDFLYVLCIYTKMLKLLCSVNHWVRIVLCPNLRKGYIMDSLDYKDKPNNENNYYFTQIVESAFETKFDWTMAKCFRQEGGWECGYFLMKFMHDLAMKKQADFPASLWDDKSRLKLSEINQVALMMLNAFYRVVVAPPLDTTDPQ